MSQDDILLKLVSYLQHKNDSATKALQEALEKGYCFGFSLCYAAMGQQSDADYLWWRSALVAVTKWDGDKEKLREQIILPGAKDGKPISLDTLLERVLHYIIFQHKTHLTEEQFVKNIFHIDILKPASGYFEILNRQRKREKILHVDGFGGSFSHVDLDKLLDAIHIQNSICLIHNLLHCTVLMYRDGKWIFYDPEFSHASLQAMQIATTEKSEIIAVIQQSQGNALGIEVAYVGDPNHPPHSFPASPFAAFVDTMTKEQVILLWEAWGFHLFLKYSPQYLNKMLTKIMEDDRAPHIIWQALVARGPFNHSGFSSVVNSDPRYLDTMLGIALRAKPSPLLLADLLATNFFLQGNGLHQVIVYAPQHLLAIFRILERAPLRLEQLVQQFSDINANGTTILHALFAHATPGDVVAIFKLLTRSSNNINKLVDLLTARDELGLTGLHVLIFREPSIVPTILAMLLGAPHLSQKLLTTFLQRDYCEITVLHSLAFFAPALIPLVLNYIQPNRTAYDVVAQAILMRDLKVCSILEILYINKQTHYLAKLFHLAAQSQKYLADLLQYMRELIFSMPKDKDQYDLLIILLENARDAQTQLQLLRQYLQLDKDLPLSMLNALPDNFHNKIQLANLIITAKIEAARTTQQVCDVVKLLETQADDFVNGLSAPAGRPKIGCAWRGSEVAQVWRKILHQAQSRILEIVDQSKCDDLSFEAVNLLKRNAERLSFLSTTDHYIKYLKLKARCKPFLGAIQQAITHALN